MLASEIAQRKPGVFTTRLPSRVRPGLKKVATQMVPQSALPSTFNALQLASALLIPAEGAFFGTLVGPAKTIAQVFLAPGGGLSRRHRELALVAPHDIVSFNVRGDWQYAPSPADFHPATLRWGLDNATHIALWSAPHPEFEDDVARWGIQASDEGGRFVTIIETNVQRVAEWAALVRRRKQPAAIVRFFGPESAGVLQ